MKKITLLILTLFSSILAQAQFPTPGTEGFEGTTGPDALPSTNWTLSTGATSNQWAVFDNGVGLTKRWAPSSTTGYPHAGTNAAFMDRENIGAGNTSEDYLATPLITVPANGQLHFWTRLGFSGDGGALFQIKVAPSTATQTNTAAYTSIQQWTETSLVVTYNVYEEKIVDLTAYAGQSVYIAFVQKFTQPTGTLGGDRWIIDDASLVAQCLTPTALTATALATTANLSWTPNGSSAWQIEVLPSTGTPTGVGTPYSGTLPYSISGLTANTSYQYCVRADCGGGNYSAWACYTFTTAPAASGCGSQFTDPGGATGNYANNANVTTTICPTNLTDLVTVTFTAFNLENTYDYLKVYAGTGTGGTQLGNFTGTTIPAAITSSVAGQCLTFVFTSDSSVPAAGWIANVTCSLAPTCPNPSALVATGVTHNQADVSWTNNATTATGFQVLALPCTSAAPTATSTGWQAATASPYTYTGLTPETCYIFYVRANCPSNDNSNWIASPQYTTQIAPPACGGTFTDPAGSSANYANSSNYTVTICPTTPGQQVTVTFTSFDTEVSWDALYVYDGSVAGTNQIASANAAANVPGGVAGGYWGTTIPGPFTSSATNGCLTFVFRSDGSVNSPGWVANVTCTPPPTCPKPTAVIVSNITQTGVTVAWTETGTANNWDVLFLPATAPAPDASTTGWINTSNNPFTYNLLTSGTQYKVYIRSKCSSTDISLWSNGLTFATSITNDECLGATIAPVNPDMTCTQVANGTVVGATASTQANACGGTSDDDVWYKFTATNTQHVISLTNITGSTTDLFHVLYSGSCGALTQMYCSDNNTSTASGLTIGQTYYIRVYTWTSTTGQTSAFNLCITTPVPPPNCTVNTPAGQNCSDAAPICNLNGYCGNTSASYTPTTGWPEVINAFCGSLENDSFLSFTAAATTVNLNVWVTSSEDNFGIQMMIFTAATCGSGPINNLVCISPIEPSATSTTVTATGLIPGQTYYVMIDGYAGDVCNYVIGASSGSGISTQVTLVPQNQTICAGQNLTLTAGGGNNTYTWTVSPNNGLSATTGTTNTFNTTTTGTYTITATSTDNNPNCPQSSSATSTITVVANVPTSFVNPAPICSGTTAPTLPASYVNGSTTITGTWSPNIVSNTATATYTFTPTTGQCASTSTLTVTVLQDCAYNTFADAVWLSNCNTSNFFNTLGTGTSIIGPVTNVFTNTNFGTYVQNSGSFKLNGGEVKTFKSTSSNVCSARLNYRIYPASGAPGTFTVMDLPFLNDCTVDSDGNGTVDTFPSGGPCNIRDQKWQNVIANTSTAPAPIDLTAYPAGNYIIEVFYDISGDALSTSGCGSTILENNNGANYKAYYTIQATPSYTSTNPTSCNATDGTITISGLAPNVTYSLSYTDDTVVVGPINITSNAAGNYVITGLNAGVYTSFSLTVNSCVMTNPIVITLIDPITTPTFTQVAPICSGATLSALPTTSNGVTGVWSPALNNTATTLYTFTPTTGQCANTATMTIVVNQPVTPTFTQVAPICSGATLSALPTTANGVTGVWSPALNNTATTLYTFTPTTGQCANTATMTIVVNQPVTPTFTQVAPICSGATLSALPTTANGVTGVWSPALNNTATTLYTFTPTTGQCANTATMTIVVNQPVTPTFTQVAPICSGATLSALPTTSNGVTGVWSPALNNTATTLYTFTPTTGQCANTATMTIVVNQPVTPTFTQVAPICSGATLSALPTTSNGVTGVWSPALNNTATTLYTFTPTTGQCANTATMTIVVNQPVTPTFTQVAPICSGATLSALPTTANGVTGVWSPALNNTVTTLYTFTPTTGQCANTATMTIVVNQPVTPTFTQVAPICSGATLSALPTTANGVTGVWSPALNNTATTLYTFTPTTGQCANTATMTIVVNQPVTPTFTQVAPICSGATLSALPTTSNGVTGVWSPALNNTATTLYTFTPTTGQCANTATMTIVVNQPVTPTFTQVAPICSGATLSALPTTSNGVTGVWSPALNNTATTLYTFTPTTGQCANTATMTIVVNQPVTPTFTQVAPICSGATLSALPTTANGVTGVWSPALNNTATTLYTFTPTTGQCANTATMTIVVHSSFDFTLTSGCENGSYMVNVVPTNNSFNLDTATYNWQYLVNTGIGNDSETLNVTQYVNSTTTQEPLPLVIAVTVTTVDGCVKTHNTTLNQIFCDIQKGISPNGDGKNEMFDLANINVSNLEIFNRYGTKVYNKSNYTTEWHGQTNSDSELPDGTYYYVIEFKNGQTAKTGWIYINREQ